MPAPANNMWPITGQKFPIYPRGSVQPPWPGLSAGSYADRQSRHYLRSLRRDGFYLGDLSTVVLWMGNGNACACADDSDGCVCPDESSPWD